MEFFQLDRFWAGAFMALAVVGAIRLLVEVERSRTGQNVAKFLSARMSAAYACTPKSVFAAGLILVAALLALVTWLYVTTHEELIEGGSVCVDKQRADDRHQQRQHHHPAMAPLGHALPESLNGGEASIIAHDSLTQRFASAREARAFINRPDVSSCLPLSLHMAKAEGYSRNPYCAHGCADERAPSDTTRRTCSQPAESNHRQSVENSWYVHSASRYFAPAQHSAKAGA